jgi:hypothetical protein
MKKIFIGFMLLVLIGCTGLNANQVVTTASDVGLAMVLNNNPAYKAPTVVALNEIKALLSGNITYDDLIVALAKYSAPEYAYIILILKADLSTDTPISTTVLPMLDSYKAGIIKRIDNYILIASI